MTTLEYTEQNPHDAAHELDALRRQNAKMTDILEFIRDNGNTASKALIVHMASSALANAKMSGPEDSANPSPGSRENCDS